MRQIVRWNAVVVGCWLLCACSKKDTKGAEPGSLTAPLSASAASEALPRTLTPGATRFRVNGGKATFLIEAPLEKIKGVTQEATGSLDVDPAELSKTRGEVRFRLSSLKTTTFEDASKNEKQTEHALNWMEVGSDAPADKKEDYEWATFTLRSVQATPSTLVQADDNTQAAPTVNATVAGDLRIHGVTSPKTLRMVVVFKGPAHAPTEVTLTGAEPLSVSLKEHDIKPRDGLGKFLNGALEKIGQKIDDNVQVSIEMTATKE